MSWQHSSGVRSYFFLVISYFEIVSYSQAMAFKEVQWTCDIPGKEKWTIMPNHPDNEYCENLKWSSKDVSPASGYTFRLEMTCSVPRKNYPQRKCFCWKKGTSIVLKNCGRRKVIFSDWKLKMGDGRSMGKHDKGQILTPNAGSGKWGPKGMSDTELLFNTSIQSILKIELQIKRNLNEDLEKELDREWKNPMFSDTVLECEGTELKCHGFILAARSKVFRACLSNPEFT